MPRRSRQNQQRRATVGAPGAATAQVPIISQRVVEVVVDTNTGASSSMRPAHTPPHSQSCRQEGDDVKATKPTVERCPIDLDDVTTTSSEDDVSSLASTASSSASSHSVQQNKADTEPIASSSLITTEHTNEECDLNNNTLAPSKTSMDVGTSMEEDALNDITNYKPPPPSYRQQITSLLYRITEDLYSRGHLIAGSMSESLNKMAGSPYNDNKKHADGLLVEWDSLIEAVGIFEHRLTAIGHHQNKITRRLADMMKEGGAIIENSGPNDHNDSQCAMCNNCRGQLANIHALVRKQNNELYHLRRRGTWGTSEDRRGTPSTDRGSNEGRVRFSNEDDRRNDGAGREYYKKKHFNNRPSSTPRQGNSLTRGAPATQQGRGGGQQWRGKSYTARGLEQRQPPAKRGRSDSTVRTQTRPQLCDYSA